MLKVGLIGSGNIARNVHIPGWAKLGSNARITAISDISPEATELAAAKIATETGDQAEIYTDYHTLIREADIEAVDICLPHHLHADAILAAVDAGKHILCEKPMCISLAEADEICAAVDRAGITYMSGHDELFYPAIVAAKSLLDQGLLGTPYIIRSTEFPQNLRPAAIPGRPPGKTAMTGWRASRETMGGGVLIDKGYHPTYILLYLAGSEPVEVTAMSNTYVAEMDGEDTALVLVKFANGAIGQIFTGEAFVFPANDAKFHLVGERGEIYGGRWDVHNRPRGLVGPSSTEYPVATSHLVFDAEILHFYDSVMTGRPPIQDHHDGRRVLEVILAAYQSIETGQTVRLPLGR